MVEIRTEDPCVVRHKSKSRYQLLFPLSPAPSEEFSMVHFIGLEIWPEFFHFKIFPCTQSPIQVT